MAGVIRRLSKFADEYRSLPALGYTHLQPAQLTTVGKRATLWIQKLLINEEEIRSAKEKLRFRGVKGTTGTQASFLQLFNGDYEKVKMLDRLVTKMAGFEKHYGVTGQTYDRLVDAVCLNSLSLLGAAVHQVNYYFLKLKNIKIIYHDKFYFFIFYYYIFFRFVVTSGSWQASRNSKNPLRRPRLAQVQWPTKEIP